LTSDEYASHVQSTVLAAGSRIMRHQYDPEYSVGRGLYALAIGASEAVMGKGRENELAENTQSFERPDARCGDWLAEARDEITDCAAWLTGAEMIASSDSRDHYRDHAIWHLAQALQAIDAWMVFERASEHRSGVDYIRPEDQPA
jgi:hypothetical protein